MDSDRQFWSHTYGRLTDGISVKAVLLVRFYYGCLTRENSSKVFNSLEEIYISNSLKSAFWFSSGVKLINSFLKAMCKRSTSDFKLLSGAKCIFGRTVRIKEVDSLPKAIYFPCDHRKIERLQKL